MRISLFKIPVFFAENRLVMRVGRGPDVPNTSEGREGPSGASETRETQETRNREFYMRIASDVEEVLRRGVTCRQIIGQTRDIVQKLRGDENFNDLYEQFNKGLNEARRRTRRFDRIKRAISRVKAVIRDGLQAYMQRVNERFPPGPPDNADLQRSGGSAAERQATTERTSTTEQQEAPAEGTSQTELNTGQLSQALSRVGDLLKNLIEERERSGDVQRTVLKIGKLIDRIIRQQGIDINNLNQDVVVGIPGTEYKMSIVNWGRNSENRPNCMVSGGSGLTCYKHPVNGWIPVFHDKYKDANGRRAEITSILCARLPDCYEITLPTQDHPYGLFKITDKENFIDCMEKLLVYSDRNWSKNMPNYGVRVQGGTVTISPKGVPYRMMFDPENPEALYFIYPGESEALPTDLDSLVAQRTQSPQEQHEPVTEVDPKVAEESKKWFRKQGEKREETIKKLETAREIENKKNIMDMMLNPKFQQFVEFPDDNNHFKIKINAETPEQKRLVQTTRIHELLNIAGLAQACLVTIEGDSGRRQGLYYPGQKTVYMLGDDGKQISERIKFYNGDTITIEEVDHAGYRDKLNDSDTSNILDPERIKIGSLQAEFRLLYKEFESKNIKKDDIDLSRLDKYEKKHDFYKPKNIFKRFNSGSVGHEHDELSNAIAEGGITLADAAEIIQDEIVIIKEAMAKKALAEANIFNPFND